MRAPIDLETEPLLLAHVSRLVKAEGNTSDGPEEVWMVSAMPGNLSAAGATEAEARSNFAVLLRSLLLRLTKSGISLKKWWSIQRAAMTDEERRALRRVIAPMLRFEIPEVEGVPLLMQRKVKSARMSLRAA